MLVVKVIGQWPDTSAKARWDWAVVAVVFFTAFLLLGEGLGLTQDCSKARDSDLT